MSPFPIFVIIASLIGSSTAGKHTIFNLNSTSINASAKEPLLDVFSSRWEIFVREVWRRGVFAGLLEGAQGGRCWGGWMRCWFAGNGRICLKIRPVRMKDLKRRLAIGALSGRRHLGCSPILSHQHSIVQHSNDTDTTTIYCHPSTNRTFSNIHADISGAVGIFKLSIIYTQHCLAYSQFDNTRSR
jgi:hypothetical protein